MSKDVIAKRIMVGENPDGGSDSQIRDPLNLLNVSGQNGTTAWLIDYHNAGGNPNGYNFRLATSRGTPAVPLTVQNGDYIFEVEAFAYNGTSFTEGAEIKVVVDGACVAGQAVPTRMEFWTNLVNALPQRKAYINAFGTLVTYTPAAGGAGFNLPHGVAPAAPVNGDVWSTSAGGLFGCINGVTQNYADKAGANTFAGVQTFTLAPVFSSATATTILAVDGAKSLVSYTLSGTGTVVPLTASPTFTGTVSVAALTASGTVTFSGGIAASGATANTWAGASGTFITSTGANTLSGAVDVNAAATPSITLNAGKTNTGFLLINGKTSGSLKLITADATAQAVTFTLAAQTVGAATLTFPDLVGVAKTVPYLERAQTFTVVQTFTLAPVFTAATATTILAVDGAKSLVSYTLSGTGTVVPLTASPTFTGTLNAAALTMTGQFKINNAAGLISKATSDGTDNGTLELNGGGGAGASRGASIILNGNEAGAFGDLEFNAGVGGYTNISTNGSKFAEWVDTGATNFLMNVATTAGGNVLGIRLGSTAAIGLFFGSGAPTITAPKGSVYFRTDGTTTLTRMYVNTDSGTTWTGLVTVA